MSHPLRGAWIEILIVIYEPNVIGSHPLRGAWIEMITLSCSDTDAIGRTPCGVRGLKYEVINRYRRRYRRTPCGVRGLKL